MTKTDLFRMFMAIKNKKKKQSTKDISPGQYASCHASVEKLAVATMLLQHHHSVIPLDPR